MGWLCALGSVLLVSAAQLLMKWAMIQLPAIARPLDFAAAILGFSPPALALLAGLFAYAFSMLCWLLALKRLPLSRAYPLLSLSYLLVWGGALLIPSLNEWFLWGKLAGGMLILAGLLLIFWPDKKDR
ncbi:4-amino-4-deoxy-L-arabinose-phospho-UDP flippase [Erwinia sp. S43]|uniref:4-amino-4-deoxy-L-arabinose-phosphoundecaprenol flippase subunit ArnF n=1 Tax=unclassified Erwinia TaxID=2622719 RepID=UPI00190BF62B|nr:MULTISPECIES: 4-amino-4-deoxy-L-arabinose-phosphoundecaprenol flippase subunit ArnF [unclassified Erwinia]MBK0031973.1 4-amino-4-deoxy-L-arabinose-phospho-UDP flippase [Erwinia sp. S43]MCW1876790.1 4-amino-4-deoxy-L-arabinose-phosphoundecaprenol flippase subunit ArnF [Erwinia sp. INIA01]